ncbi:MAG TPA: hypothetical protein VMF58_18760 [Rhizomicrobium sp.]|nr:hypothetical protein [Rhizomicrobium sp.]
MNSTPILGAIAVLPLIAGNAFAAKPAVLWNQNSASEGTVFSQNSDANTTAGADDFAVPSGQTWLISEVDVTGMYFNGSGPATSEVVTFYSDKKGKPNRVKQGPFTLNCADNGGSFQCTLPKRVKLKAGTWWVSVVANCNFETCSEWGWNVSATVQGHEAVWENPTGSGACTSWQPLHVCFGGSPLDLAFELRGRAVESK